MPILPILAPVPLPLLFLSKIGSSKQRSGDTFDFARLWDAEDGDGAPTEVSNNNRDRSDHRDRGGVAAAAATPRQPVNLSSILGSSGSSRSKTTPGSGSSSAASSRRPPASGSGTGSNGQSSAAGTRRSDVASAAGDSLNEGPEDINELLGLIGDRLNKRFDTKKRKLESFAEKALSEAQSNVCFDRVCAVLGH